MEATLEHLAAAAHAGGDILRRHFGNHVEVKVKSAAADFQTSADLASEAAILAILAQEFPSYNIHAEERGKIAKGSEFTFVVDPLDGTNNFVLGVPYFSVSIALLQRDRIIAAVVHQPMTGHTYTAQDGGGAFSDGTPIRVNQQSDLRHATLAYIAPYGNTPEVECDFPRPFFAAGIKRLLTFWSPALEFCLLASGKIEAVVHNGSEFYDFAACKLIGPGSGSKNHDVCRRAGSLGSPRKVSGQ